MLQVSAADFERKRPQDFDFFLVFDLEGKVEILEFPVLIIDAKKMGVVDLFHRFNKINNRKLQQEALIYLSLAHSQQN